MLCIHIDEIRIYHVCLHRITIIDCMNTYLLLVEEFTLPREEARRLIRAYSNVWDLQIDNNKIQSVFDSCSRNSHVLVDDVLKRLAQ
jgi:hypothetical protein